MNATAGETCLLDDGFKFSDTILEARSLVFCVWICFVNLIDAESGL